MYTDYLIIGGVAFLTILLVLSIVKKAVKLLIAILIIFIIFSAYNIVVKGVSPIDELNGYKTNIAYSISIGSYTGKVQKSVSNLKLVLDSQNADEITKARIKTENDNLHKYQAEILVLKHTEKLNLFHKQYCAYVGTIVGTSDAALNAGVSIDKIKESINQGSSVFDNLSKLRIEDFLKK